MTVKHEYFLFFYARSLLSPCYVSCDLTSANVVIFIFVTLVYSQHFLNNWHMWAHFVVFYTQVTKNI